MKREDFSTVTRPVPAEYLRPDCPELGDVEEFVYDTVYYAGDKRPLQKPCYVYTPFGYDPEDTETKYDILYCMHGFLCNANTLFEGRDGYAGNIIDHLIYHKETRPLIVVALTWDYENQVRDFGTSYDQIMAFHEEFRNDIIPAVEAVYHTYGTREHRGFAGYSMGAVTTWQVFLHCTDLCQWYAPLACDSWVHGQFGGAKKPKETAQTLASAPVTFRLSPKDYSIYCGAGDKDNTLYQQVPQIFEMWKLEPENESPKPFTQENLTLHIVPGGEHGFPAFEELLYNALPELFPGPGA